MRYSFSGHESFHCKSLWLKKGYDFICSKKHFADTDSVVELGVGKNMVSAIRYWLKAFSLTKEDTLTDLAEYIFSTNTGRDPFCEDIATLWVLHYNLVKSQVASIYQLVFIDFQRERREFDKVQLLSFIKRKCSVPEQKNVYNENTVSKDINVFLHSYIEPNDLKQLERYSALLINLGLMREIEKGVYRFQEIDTDSIPDVVILYALCDIKGEDKLLSFDKIQELSLLFCIPIASFLDKVRHIAEVYSDYITYSDNSGIRNIYFKDNIESIHLLDMYYNHEI